MSSPGALSQCFTLSLYKIRRRIITSSSLSWQYEDLLLLWLMFSQSECVKSLRLMNWPESVEIEHPVSVADVWSGAVCVWACSVCFHTQDTVWQAPPATDATSECVCILTLSIKITESALEKQLRYKKNQLLVVLYTDADSGIMLWCHSSLCTRYYWWFQP